MMEDIERVACTVRVIPEVWKSSLRSEVEHQGRSSLEQFLSENGLTGLPKTYKMEVIHTVVVTDYGYSEIPGEVNWDNIAWYTVGFEIKGYRMPEFKMEFKYGTAQEQA